MGTLLRPILVAGVAAAVVVATSLALTTRPGGRPASRSPRRLPTSTMVDPAPGPVTGATSATSNLDGARSAALAYLALSERVVDMDIEAAVAAQREAATATAAPGLVADLRQRLGALRSAFPGGGLHYRVGALAVRVVPGGGGQAQVEVWYVGVLSAPGVAPYEQWHLSRYDLAWERGGWRVAAETTGPGPRPAAPLSPEPTTEATLETVLGGFTSATSP
jgi:hypothetical protein